ncbi:Succinylglutamate desuccinylase / Aspartoacylase family protein [Stieleria maiorica]|uniref:Succinylglutamate desuccinylase / Aspartoacylase family protein n=1 Tax=Stieleria maiorica TaxID=2795974 RepID=A0A5B9MC85_9BACT|nr:succinylglutamate desuccinylase/aspartoacylase family protein [Stieleria maiorica]QEF98119.1 Succinylglutamate desuccinylase / Aspartoacylase family protein [Stieleria maiorica]
MMRPLYFVPPPTIHQLGRGISALQKTRSDRHPAGQVFLAGWFLVLAFALAVGPSPPAQGQVATSVTSPTITSGTLGAKATWNTPWYVIDSGHDGPTVLITGGIHGNEPAGARAAEQIRHWPIERGKLVVIPRVNRLGLAADIRWTPEHRNDRRRRDLNRSFPTDERDEALTDQSAAIWDFVMQHQPEWVFDLHEGFDFHRINPKSVGSSVIAFPSQRDFAKRIQRSVNVVMDPKHPFDLLAQNGPVVGSLARACGEQLGAASFIFETTFKDQPISLRTRQHRHMVSTALLSIGMITEDCVDRFTPAPQRGMTSVAVFDDSGANETKVLKVLDGRPELSVRLVGRDDMRPSVLEQFDVLVFPGGSGSKQGNAIGAQRRDHVRRFVRDGGGIVGICAGAYLCSSHYAWSLDLMNAAVFNKTVEIPGKGRKSMWYRGPATDVDVELTARAAEVLGVSGTIPIRYQNGPILSAGDDDSLPEFEPWAYFRSENGIYEPQKDTMIGAPAIVFARYGQGRVLAISPHFESTAGQADVIPLAIAHVRKRSIDPR